MQDAVSDEDAVEDRDGSSSGEDGSSKDTSASGEDGDSDDSNTTDRESSSESSSETGEDSDSDDTSDSDEADNNSASGSGHKDSWTSSPYLPNGAVPDSEYHITVNLSTGVPIADVSCKSHEINVAKNGDSQATITLANPEDYAGNRDFILKYKLTNETVQSGLMLTSSGDENYFLLTVQPPERFTPDDIPPREYIFVLDISGSMYGYPWTPPRR